MPDAYLNIPVYNDNQACVDWSRSTTTKGIKHLNLRENMIRETVHDKEATIFHIPGVINGSDLFTKEIRDQAHFCACRDSMMVSKANFLTHHHSVPAHLTN